MIKPTHEKEVDVLPTMRAMANAIREQLNELDLDESTSLAAAAILLKFSLSLYRASLHEDEIAELLQHSLSTIDQIEIIPPRKRITH